MIQSQFYQPIKLDYFVDKKNKVFSLDTSIAPKHFLNGTDLNTTVTVYSVCSYIGKNNTNSYASLILIQYKN